MKQCCNFFRFKSFCIFTCHCSAISSQKCGNHAAVMHYIVLVLTHILITTVDSNGRWQCNKNNSNHWKFTELCCISPVCWYFTPIFEQCSECTLQYTEEASLDLTIQQYIVLCTAMSCFKRIFMYHLTTYYLCKKWPK